MRTSDQKPDGFKRSRLQNGFSLIELLVVVSIICLLTAMLFPALNLARESSRQATCASNLRQFYITMAARHQRGQPLCSGAFDWRYDGCVTEIGWVADLVKEGVPVGNMLCPSNPCQISRTFNDLLNLNVSPTDDCVDRLGSPSVTEPDGTITRNPCRAIVELGLAPGSEERRQLVEQQIFAKHYNTNYTASWWLVRSGVRLDASGNLQSDKAGCEASLLSRRSTFGPLMQVRADTARCSGSVPLLGCGAAAEPLMMPVGTNPSGTFTTQSITSGPVRNPSMVAPHFEEGTPSGGASGWLAVWNATLQDYRNFAPVHRGSCNLLFADGSVRSYLDANRDSFLNNGFLPTANNGFKDDKVELPPEEVMSKWYLK